MGLVIVGSPKAKSTLCVRKWLVHQPPTRYPWVTDMSVNAPNPDPGDHLGSGRFQLVRELGRGGRGVVWLAHDQQLNEHVAIKLLPPELVADPIALEDLRRETQKNRALSHPNIVRIHDLIQPEDEQPFISLEYIHGHDLSTIRAQRPSRLLTWTEIEPWILQLCDALSTAHSEQIVHRDLKPNNLMIDDRRRLKLADFGIAATMADALNRVTIKPDGSGTLMYMSPQQMDGEPPRATDDIYALGATLFELLAGQPPFHSGDIASQVRHTQPPSPTSRLTELNLQNEIPTHIEQLILACLAKDPVQRPQSASDIAQWIQTGNHTIPENNTASDIDTPLRKLRASLRRRCSDKTLRWWDKLPAPTRSLYTAALIALAWIPVEMLLSTLAHGGNPFATLHGAALFRPF